MQYSSSLENYSSSTLDSPRKWNNKDTKGYVYQKSSYQFGNTGTNQSSYSNHSSQNIDQLDSLLEDLKNERQITRERDLLSTSTSSKALETNEPYGTITKTTRVIKTTQYPMENERISSDYSTSGSHAKNNYSDSINRHEYKNKEKIYSSTPLPESVVYENKSKIYENNVNLSNAEIVPIVSTATAKDIETDLKNISFTGEILPLPGTKVTTTVRTYTYEIPGDVSTTSSTINRNQNIMYKNYVQNESKNMELPQQQFINAPKELPSTIVYNTESYSTHNREYERPIVNTRPFEIHEHRETSTNPQVIHSSMVPGGITKNKIIYNVNTTENIDNIDKSHNYLRNSPMSGPISANGRIPQHVHVPQPTTNRYFYKETSNVINTIHGPESPGETNLKPTNYEMKHVPINYPPPSENPYSTNGSPSQSNTLYKYSSNTTANTKYANNLPNKTLPPAPFPVEGLDQTLGNPPQKVDDLMQSFGNVDAVDKSDVDIPLRKREIETAVASPNQPTIPSINRAGREVYYPPGHDTMITKREEMYASGASGGGRWAKGSGMYEYESGYKSKSKTKSGGAMVPVCLPLCCAMPCSIM